MSLSAFDFRISRWPAVSRFGFGTSGFASICLSTVLALFLIGQTAISGQGSPEVLWATNAHIPGVPGYGHLSIAFSPDSRLLASAGGNDIHVKIWAVGDGQLLQTLTNPVLGVGSVVFSPDGRALASTGEIHGVTPEGQHYNVINVWDTADWRWRGITNYVYIGDGQVVFSHNGKYLAAAGGGWYGDLAIFKFPEGNLVNRYGQNITGYASLGFSPDDCDLAASCFYAASTQIRNATNGTVRIDLPIPTASVAFSPDGATLMVAEDRDTARAGGVWPIHLVDVATGTIRGTLLHPGSVYTAAFTPDGKGIISWAGDNKIRLWRLLDATVLQTYDQETTAVRALAVSPNGRYFAYGRDDGVVVLARITDITHTNNEVRLTWTGGSGLYQLQQTADLTAGLWEDAGQPTTNLAATVNASGPLQFFRVQSLPQP